MAPEPALTVAAPATPAAQAVAGRRVRWWRAGWIVFMLLATSLPYFANYLATPAGFHYTWVLPPFPQDTLAYMAWSEQAARGEWLFRIKYTAIPHAPFLLHPVFLVCGWLKALLGWPMGLIHLLMKGVGIVLFWWILFGYLDHLKLGRFRQAAATLLIGLSSGVGWLAWRFFGIGGSDFAADLTIPDVNTFWSLLWNPLFPWSLAGLVLVFHLLDRGSANGSARDMWLAGLTASVLTLIHPYHVPIIFSLAALLVLVRRRERWLGLLARFYGAALPLIALTFLISKLHPLVSRHSGSGEMTSPPPLAYALGFGLPLLLAFAAVLIDRRQAWKKYTLPLLWVALAFGLSYLPFWFQRKFVYGVHIPLCILAAIGLDRLLERFAARRRRTACAVAAALMAPLLLSSQVFLLADQRDAVRGNAEDAYYIGDDLRAGLAYLARESAPADLVFAAEGTSTFVPAYAGNTVIWGHWAMSVDFDERLAWLRQVAGLDAERAGAELARAGIRYVLVDDEFRKVFGDFGQRIGRPYAKVFERGSVTIYRAAS